MAIQTFDRLNDKVNSSDFVNLLYDENELKKYFEKKKVSSKLLDQIKRYTALLGKGIEKGDGSVKYTINDNGIKGFTNTLGYNNVNEKGEVNDKLWAYAVNYATNKLNSLPAYKEPEEKSSKIKYSNSAIGTIINRYIYGSDDSNLQDFLDLDKYNKETKTRANTNRAALFRKSLEYVRDNWDNLFDGWSDDLKITALKNIENAFPIFDNDRIITDDEYLILRKATGMNNLRNMFQTGENTSDNLSDKSNPESPTRTYKDKIKWIERTYKPYAGKLKAPRTISIPDTEAYDITSVNTLNNKLTNSSNKLLYEAFKEILAGTNTDNTSIIKSAFPNSKPRFSANYLMNSILLTLSNRSDGLYNFGESNPYLYYIPDTKTTNNTGLVWDSEKRALNEMSIHKIPYWIDRINNEWESLDGGEEALNPELISSYPNSYKKGGVLKALKGTVMNRLGVHNGGNWLNIENTSTNAYNTNLWDLYYNNAGIDNNLSLAILGLSTGPWLTGYLKDLNGNVITDSDGNVKYGISAAQLGILLNALDLEKKKSKLSFNKTLNTRGYELWNKIFDLTGFNEYFGGDSGDVNHPNRMDFMGPSTYNRHYFIERLKNTYNNADNKLEIDGKGIYYNGKNWELENMMSNGKYAPLETYPLNTDPSLDPSTIKIKPNPPAVINGFVGEEPPKDKGKGVNWDKITLAVSDFTPYAINTAMLFDSLHSNLKIWKTLDNAILPKSRLHTWTPRSIQGRWGELKSDYSVAAGTDRLGDRLANAQTDSSLGAAIRLLANTNANNIRTKANLDYDKSIEDALELAWQNVRNFLYVKDEDAIFNRAEIVDSIMKKAQNTAQKYYNNLQSRANFGDFTSKFYWYNKSLREKNLEDQNTLYLNLVNDEGDALINEAESRFYQSYNDWLETTDENGTLINKNKNINLFLLSKEGQMAQSWIEEARRLKSKRLRSIQNYIYKINPESLSNIDDYNYTIDYTKNYNTIVGRHGTKLIPRRK